MAGLIENQKASSYPMCNRSVVKLQLTTSHMCRAQRSDQRWPRVKAVKAANLCLISSQGGSIFTAVVKKKMIIFFHTIKLYSIWTLIDLEDSRDVGTTCGHTLGSRPMWESQEVRHWRHLVNLVNCTVRFTGRLWQSAFDLAVCVVLDQYCGCDVDDKRQMFSW